MQDIENIHGTVVTIVRDKRGSRAVVDVDANVICPRCATGKGCGAGIFGNSGKSRRIEAVLSDSADISEGDDVSLALGSRNLLLAAWIVYGWPLVGGASGALLASVTTQGDAVAAAAALAGLALGAVLARRQLGRKACLTQFVPVARRQPGLSGS
jgi:sigma-E factor negative regulatory protein RseC